MAAISKSGTPSLATLEPGYEHQIPCVAAEDIAAFDACYISGVASNGQPKATRSDGTAATAAAKVRGYAAAAAKSGEAVTLYDKVRVRYGAGLTPGGNVFLMSTPGALSDVATIGGTAPLGHILSATDIMLWASNY